jgi:transcriptional regulator with XRE-family HTH domain
MSLQNEINETIQNRMKALKINNVKLANLSGISPQHIGKLLKGSRKWNAKMQEKVFNALGIKVTYKTTKLKKRTS